MDYCLILMLRVQILNWKVCYLSNTYISIKDLCRHGYKYITVPSKSINSNVIGQDSDLLLLLNCL